MGLFNWFKEFFSSADATPADERRLSGASEGALASSLQNLRPGERGWTTLAEAARLFSTQEAQSAFGDFDDAGKTHLAQFAAGYRCRPDFRPTEGRLYFRRNA
jgi:hypothetical protein